MRLMRRRKTLGARARRQRRIRAKISGVADRPRLNVFRSNQHIYAQLIDDTTHHTVAAASTLDPAVREALEAKQAKQAQAAEVGRVVAETSTG